MRLELRHCERLFIGRCFHPSKELSFIALGLQIHLFARSQCTSRMIRAICLLQSSATGSEFKRWGWKFLRRLLRSGFFSGSRQFFSICDFATFMFTTKIINCSKQSEMHHNLQRMLCFVPFPREHYVNSARPSQAMSH